MVIKKVYQQNVKDCGVACLISIIRYYKGDNTFENIRYLTNCSNNGITALNLIEASKKLGFNAEGFKCNYEDLKKVKLPCISHVTLKDSYNHYVVIYKVTDKSITVFDPYYGVKKYLKDDFIKIWKSNVIIELIPNRKLDVIKNNNYKFLKNILIKNRYLYIIIILTSFISIILTLYSNTFFKTLIDNGAHIYILYFFISVIIIRELTNYFQNKLLILLESKIDKQMQLNTHNKLLSLPNYYFYSRCVGDIITKFNDLSYVKELLIQPIIVVIDIILIIFCSFILIKINLHLSIIFYIFCLLYIIILTIYNKKMTKLVKINQETNSVKNSILQENIMSIDTIKNMNLINYRHNIFKEVCNLNINSNKQYQYTYILLNMIRNIVMFIGINIILFLGINYVNNNLLSLSSLILFNSIIMYFIEPINDFNNLFSILKNGINALKRIEEIYSIDDIKYMNKTNNFDININDLDFSYNNYNYILKDFSYKIKFKDKIIVIGKSGKGKSTLFKILNKSYKIDNNYITIGSKDLNEIDINKYLTYSSQNEILFNDSIHNNIVLNNKIDNLDKVIKITKLDEVLKRRNLTLDSIIEENGSNFSLGEKQKIIISRVLLRNTPIIIFDETLSGIDNKEEYEIMSNILKEFSDKTIIYISHSNVCKRLFNKIVDFDKMEV